MKAHTYRKRKSFQLHLSMYTIQLSLLFALLINIINSASNLRCKEDTSGSLQLVHNCRSCVIFIETKVSTTIVPRKLLIQNKLPIQQLFSYNKKKIRRRSYTNTVVRRKCAREFNGPLYGYDQTHCYCDSNQCNSNIQRCIYEIASKRYFSCYHGSNSSRYSLGIYKKCRSCRIRIESDLTYHYECLTFGEREQKNRTHCTCQHPMCNQDVVICQHFQQIPTVAGVNLVDEKVLNSTIHTSTSTILTVTTITSTITTTTSTSSPTPLTTTTTRITSSIINSTNKLKVLSTKNQTEEIFTDNLTLVELTSASQNKITEAKIVLNETKNHAKYFSSSFSCISNACSLCLLHVIISFIF